MKSKEEILTEHANADGLRLNNSDWGDWLLKAMDIYAAQEVGRAIAEHEAKQWHESQPEPQHENDFMKEPLDASIKRKAELYNSPEIDAIMDGITPEQYNEKLKEMMEQKEQVVRENRTTETAKELAKEAFSFIEGYEVYWFTEKQFHAFIDQLCKEQREICAVAYLENDRWHETFEESIQNAKQPEV